MAVERKSGDFRALAQAEVRALASGQPGTKGGPGAGKRASTARTGAATSPAVAIEPQRVAPRRTRRTKGPRTEPRFVRLGSALFTILAALLIATVFIVSRFDVPGPLEQAKTFIVPRGESMNDIAERLERDGIITNRWTFMAVLLASRLSGTAKKGGDVKAGAYEFKAAATMRDVADILTEGKSALAKITIPEGLTSYQIVERLKGIDALAGEISAIPPEGSLLPDTIVVQRGASRQEIIDRMQAELQKTLAAAWEKRAPNLPIQTPQQALILASIVEKETGRADERPRVAAVFVNRLRKKMRLQSDPTIIYGVTQGQGPLGRPIYRSDIDQKTEYNTYQIDGLPPTPIANVGRLAIEATLNPAATNDIYFVADGTGGHTFSETLKDHNAAVANWRRVERESKAAREAAAREASAAPAAGAAAQAVGAALSNAAQPANGVRVNGQVKTATSAEHVPVAPADAEVADPGEAAAAAPDAGIPLPVRKPKR